ncbi:DUF1801 domain-containing protein [Nocardia sp. CS682]|uniref:DUF1801 domain-containing protein n=1 Tax=Nocardia sp. CS682 TaxID=1047172 RepID=UPI0010C5B5C9|nr:DUF1801 domain-containing protein [Nocardia sp. CS682]QBS44527.1 hypothetical protein DMB37_35000 [Nocardia sp. CS682]
MTDEHATGIQAWLAGLDENQRGRAEALVAVVSAADPRLQQAVKWGRITFTIDNSWHDWLCAIAAAKKGVRLVFHKGALLNDPAGLLSGSARYVRELTVEQALESPAAVDALIRSAVAHQTDLIE